MVEMGRHYLGASSIDQQVLLAMTAASMNAVCPHPHGCRVEVEAYTMDFPSYRNAWLSTSCFALSA